MSSALLLNEWPDILNTGPEQSGGKGWNLARLARYGLPVTEFVVIPAHCQRQWLLDSGLFPQLHHAAASLEQQAQPLDALHQQLLQQPLPQSLLDTLAELLNIRGWQQQPLAVRSSATAEDSVEHSFAGIHLTRLNVIGAEALATAVREVWASLWTAAAVAYRQRIGRDHESVAMAVVIMPLLPAVSNGIAFTCDPHNGRDDRIHIHAHWGLGEALVSGAAHGDEIVLEEDPVDDSLHLLSYHRGDKAAITLCNSTGTQTIATPTQQAQQQVLDKAAALKLGRLVRDAAIALDFVAPFFDIEWVWDGEQFWLVQARPITTRPRHTYPALANQPEIWTRGNTCEVVPEPLSAIEWFSSRRLINLLLEQGPKLIGYPLLPGAQRAGLFNGRLYLNLSLMQWEFFEIFGLQPHVVNSMMGGHQPEITVPETRWRDKLRRIKNMMHHVTASLKRRRHAEKALQQVHDTARLWRQQFAPQNESALLKRLQEQSRYSRSTNEIFFLQASSGASISQLAEFIEKHLPGEGHALTAALLTGGNPSVTTLQSYALVELAHLAAGDHQVRDWLADPQRDNGWWQQLPQENAFRRGFADFLDRYGHRAVYESYTRNPRWREQPGYLLDTIHGLMETDIQTLRQQQQQAATSAQQRIKQTLSIWLRPLIHMLIRAATQEGNHREAARSALIALLEPLRTTLLTIGQLWQQRGILGSADDIFNLTLPEIYDALSGEIAAQGLSNRVSDRRQQLRKWFDVTAAPVIIQHNKYCEEIEPQPTNLTATGDAFMGVAVGTGVAHGAARILRSPTEGTRLNRGEILVASSTDPSWTPLFLKAGGIVVETGGSLSHSAIVAREFGIPAVVNLPGIVSLIQDGELVEVDGRQGTVKRLNRGE